MPAHSTSRPTTVEYVHPPADLVELTKTGTEIWRPVVGTDGWYEVSNLGAVRSWVENRGPAGRVRAKTPSLLAQHQQPDNGYMIVTLRIDGRQKCPPVHCLVAEAFIGPRPGYFRFWQASHADDNPTRNSLDNIRWATTLANWADRRKNCKNDRVHRQAREVDGVKQFQCTGPCGEWKPESGFRPIKAKGSRSKCGVQSFCIDCARARGREQKRASREKARTA